MSQGKEAYMRRGVYLPASQEFACLPTKIMVRKGKRHEWVYKDTDPDITKQIQHVFADVRVCIANKLT